ncbi:MAG: YebC/PmpR family DNA-binding transcriptional regulator [Proteobacteria bacterium]|nr:YebC/PmpR family DNA-binding transcriptional regulator [Pseudomonadota bacterium]MBU1639975.1 YebC/PmpR family DNA-binding transcriptional regulator [Pseudomonadota bacterium]
MSGHSKWANIKHRKGAQDAKRGKIFTRLIKEISVAARMGGGGDVDSNPRLRSAVSAAKNVNMPKDNIDRAIKKGTGELEGETYEEIRYEGYGPGGVAVLVDCMTDNRNRTVGEVRFAFTKSGGNLGESGCVAFMFDRKGSIIIDKEEVDEDELMEVVLEAGAEDVVEEETTFQVLTAPEDFDAVREELEKAGIKMVEAAISMIPQNTIEVAEEKKAASLMRLIDALEDNEDVQHVHANFDIPDEIMERLA